MKKMLSNIGKIFLVIIILLTSGFSSYINVKATQTNIIKLYVKSSYGNLIKYNNKEIITKYVVYDKDGTEYPAYGTNPNAQGVEETERYAVKSSTLLSDVELWKVVINGYPYKTYSTLGCQNKEEAYTATEQAIYCKIFGRTPNDYEAIGEAGTRVKNAMSKILNDAQYSSKYSSELKLIPQEGEFLIDKVNGKYMSQSFSISIGYSIKDIKLSLEGDYPEGTKIVNSKNEEIKEYTGFTTFKVIYPIKNAEKNGSFKLKAVATTYSYPVLYGMAYKLAPTTYSAEEDFERQNYILTGSTLGDSETSKTLNYDKNKTKIVIVKLDKGLNKPLEGVRFRLLDRSKNPVYTDLVTDVEGKITIDNISPGRYYLEETYTQEGYIKYDELIPAEVSIDETLTITVKNSKEDNQKYGENNSNITVEKDESNTDIYNQEENINKQETNNNLNVNNNNKNTNLQETNNDININNKNENSNQQETNTNININNENINTNKQETNTNANINNQNENTNKENMNVNTNINNENKNTNETVSNDNTNVNKQEINTNVQNNNTNINQNNGKVKLPKTGM